MSIDSIFYRQQQLVRQNAYWELARSPNCKRYLKIRHCNRKKYISRPFFDEKKNAAGNEALCLLRIIRRATTWYNKHERTMRNWTPITRIRRFFFAFATHTNCYLTMMLSSRGRSNRETQKPVSSLSCSSRTNTRSSSRTVTRPKASIVPRFIE